MRSVIGFIARFRQLCCLVVASLFAVPVAVASFEVGVERALTDATPTGSCASGPTNLCLSGGRFHVILSARDQRTGSTGPGQAIPQSDLFGYFSIPALTNDPDNPEVFVKVIDGRTVNGNYWVFYGGLTDLEYTLSVTDTATGSVKAYSKQPGSPCGGFDTGAFSTSGTSSLPSSRLALSGGTPETQRVVVNSENIGPLGPLGVSIAGTCAPGTDSLCLHNGRFRVTLSARDQRTSNKGHGQAIPQNDLFGYFSIPALTGNPSNPEVFVKVLDGRALNSHHWVFYGGLTDLEYTVTVTDTETGAQKTYHKNPGSPCGGFDTEFPIERLFATVTLEPPTGPSGTPVTIRGEGFSLTDSVKFGSVDAPLTVFLSPDQLATVVPLTQQGDVLAPLPAGPVPLLINGVEAGTFTVQPLPENPNPPGAVLQTVTNSLAQQFTANRSAMDAAIGELQSSTADPAARAYLQKTRELLPEIEQFLTEDLQSLLTLNDPSTFAIVERLLLSQFPSEARLQSGANLPARPMAAGDDWLEERMADVVLAKRLEAVALLVTLAGFYSRVPDLSCKAEIAIFVLFGASQAVVNAKIGKKGKIVGLRISDKADLPPLPGDLITLQSGQSVQLFAGIFAQSSITELNPLSTEAFTLTKDCLRKKPPLLIEKLFDLLIEQLQLFPLIEDKTIGRPFGPLPVSFINLQYPILITARDPCTTALLDGTVRTSCRDEQKRRDIRLYQVQRGFLLREEEKSAAAYVKFDVLPPPGFEVRVRVFGTGTGTVTSNPARINCATGNAGTCSASFTSDAPVVLTALPRPGTDSFFAGWGGDCAHAGSNPTCSFRMTGAKNVSATFSLPTSFDLTVRIFGTGTGTVTSNPARINCATGNAGTCSASFTSDAPVVLTALPRPGTDSLFAGWGGDCAHAGTNSTCSFQMTGPKNVTATFSLSPPSFDLTVSILGTGGGLVLGNIGSGGINCRRGNVGVCASSVLSGTPVALGQAASSSSFFAGWGGDCAHAGTNFDCRFQMTGPKNVTATFESILPTQALVVTPSSALLVVNGLCRSQRPTSHIARFQTFSITSTGGPLAWSARLGPFVSPPFYYISSSGPSSLTVTANITIGALPNITWMDCGTDTVELVITAPGASNPEVRVLITVKVNP